MSSGERGRRVLRPGLLARLVVALALVGALPLLVTWVQLRGQEDALVEQVQRTHAVAAAATAARTQAFLERTVDLAESLADQPSLAEPASTAAQELLRGSLAARPDLRAIGLFDEAGETVLLARRAPVEPVLGELLASDETLRLGRLAREEPDDETAREGDAGRRVLAVRRALTASRGSLVVVADADELDEIVRPVQLGDEAALWLVSDALETLAGTAVDAPLVALPEEILEQARGGRIGSGVRVVRGDDAADRASADRAGADRAGADRAGADRVVAFARVEGAPWFVLSTQPARVAEVARQRIVDAGRWAALAAAALTLVLSLLAWRTVVRPLRRLAAAQRDLVGDAAGGGRDEIEQLETSFAILRQRIQEKQDLGEVFLGRYKVTDLIGSGAMGSVFRGWDGKLGRPVALKTIHLDAAPVDARRLVDSLRQEAALSARLSQPNIVTIYDIEDPDLDAGTAGGASAFIAMEYVDGINLRDLLRARHRLDPDRVAPLLLEIARGLAAAHRSDLVHHDVKPANILLGHDGSVKLTDFGISQTLSAAARDPQVICGTPGYIAPEVLNGGDYEPASDVWAMAVVGWECLVGKHPFRAGTLQETVVRTMTVEPPATHGVVPGVDRRLSSLLADLMASDLDERRWTSEEVVDHLDALCRERGLRWSADFDGVGAGGSGADPRPFASGTRLMTRSGLPVDGRGSSLSDARSSP